MSTDSAHHSQWAIAEVVFGIPFLASLALHFAAPGSLPLGVLRPALIPVGIALIISGIGLIVAARREFARYGQPTDPGHPTSQVIRAGIFAISRNPLYLGTALVLLGVALNLLWSLVTLLLSLILRHTLLIRPEERYLTAKFGEDYQAYTAIVHRWLGCNRVKPGR